MTEIAITDDHQIVIEGIRTMLKSSKDILISQSYNTIAETLAGLTPNIQVLLLDINLPDGNGITACKEILRCFPDLKIIALTNFEEIAFIKQMVKNGALGYLLKNTDKSELLLAIQTVLTGEHFLQPKIKESLIKESLGKTGNSSFFIPKLTSREKEILDLIIKEYTTEEIAAKIFVSIKTVESHRGNLIQKLGVKNSAGLVRVAFEKGLV